MAPGDPVLTTITQHMLLVQIRGTEEDAEELARRFDKAPKPMYYPETFLRESWAAYLIEKSLAADKVDPDDFIRWGFRRLLTHRLPRYDTIADRWGVSVTAADVAAIRSTGEFDDLIADALQARTSP